MGSCTWPRSTSGMRVAVKVVHARYALDPEFRGRFRQEVAAARQVSGAFTAPVVDADPDAGRPWMATLYIPGPTLSEQVKRNGPMDPAQLRRLMAGLAEALRDIHRVGVVHPGPEAEQRAARRGRAEGHRLRHLPAEGQ